VRRGELRCAAEPALLCVEHRLELPVGLVHHICAELDAARWRGLRAQRRRHAAGRVHEFISSGQPELRDPRNELHHPGSPEPARLRQIGRREERLLVRRHDYRERPSATARQHPCGVHVDGVYVGALLAVDLDADERLIKEGGDLVVLKRLALHDVAPVTRRVADRQEHGFVLCQRPVERLLSPRVPVDGVRRVLQQIRALLAGEVVGRAVAAGLVGRAGHHRRDKQRRDDGQRDEFRQSVLQSLLQVEISSRSWPEPTDGFPRRLAHAGHVRANTCRSYRHQFRCRADGPDSRAASEL